MSSNDKNCLRLSNNSDDIYPLMDDAYLLGVFTI
jgi:hypothetical protein